MSDLSLINMSYRLGLSHLVVDSPFTRTADETYSQFTYDLCKPLDRVRRSFCGLCPLDISTSSQQRSQNLCHSLCRNHRRILRYDVLSFVAIASGAHYSRYTHVVGDLRYLMLKDKIYKKEWFWLAVALPFFLFLDQQSIFATFAIVLTVFKTRRQGIERRIVQFSALLLFAVSIQWPRYFLYAFTYAQHHWHCNMVVLEEEETKMGNVATVTMHDWKYGNSIYRTCFALQYHPPSMGIDYYGRRIAGFASGNRQVSWVLLFAFLQSIHYLVWIRLIPEEDRPQKTP